MSLNVYREWVGKLRGLLAYENFVFGSESMISDGTVSDARARRSFISITFSSTLLASVLATASLLFATPVFAQGVLGDCAAEYTTGQDDDDQCHGQ